MKSMPFSEEEYQKLIDWLFIQMPNYQQDGEKAYKPGLDNITKLCALFGNPQEKLKTIHIGGTNGKGSTSNMLASILQEQGYKVGLYNSPHLIDFTERIKINGENCDKEFVYYFIKTLQNLPKDILPSFFEFTTIMAFEYFYKEKVDYAIIEVGLGGRLDSTNIIKPMVCAITNVQLDHQNILGTTLEEIAKEKAGIIKKSTPIVFGEEKEHIKNMIKKKAELEDAEWIDAMPISTNYKTDLQGNYQEKNKKVALALVAELRKLGITISEKAVKNGLLQVQKNTKFIGRWFVFSQKPLIISDTAHNSDGLQAVLKQLAEFSQKKHFVLGFVEEKKMEEILPLFPKDSVYYFVKPSVNRGKDPKIYENLIKREHFNYQVFASVQSGFQAARENCKEDEMIFVGGSNYVVGEFLQKNLEK